MHTLGLILEPLFTTVLLMFIARKPEVYLIVAFVVSVIVGLVTGSYNWSAAVFLATLVIGLAVLITWHIHKIRRIRRELNPESSSD